MQIGIDDNGYTVVVIPPDVDKTMFKNEEFASAESVSDINSAIALIEASLNNISDRFGAPAKMSKFAVGANETTEITVDSSSRAVLFLLGGSGDMNIILISSSSNGTVTPIRFGTNTLVLATSTNKLAITNSTPTNFTGCALIYLGDVYIDDTETT